ncbi:MAG: hypothetical protein ACI9FO_000855 [Methylophagaceae bacterium]|jgi:hypothetical protein
MGQAFYQWQDDDVAVEMRGLVRGFGVAINNPNDSVLFAKDTLLTGAAFGRLMLDIDYKSSLSFELHAMQSVVDDNLRTGGSRFASLVDIERSDAMDWRFADQQADLVMDRINVQYSTDKLNIKLGRQPINLATTFYFTPNDFFAPFAAQTFYRSYKSGVDAARLDWQLSELSQLSLITVVNYTQDFATNTGWSKSPDWSETAYLARISTLFNSFEFAGLAGKVNGDDIIGVDFQGELFHWLGVRGEGHMRFPEQVGQSRHVKFTLGLEHRFENTLTLRLEQFYQGVGVADNSDYNAAILADQTNLYLARKYTALGVNYEITPLLVGDAVWLVNNDDSSNLLALYIARSLSDESELAIGLNLARGERPDNGIISSEFGRYPTSLSVEYRLYF